MEIGIINPNSIRDKKLTNNYVDDVVSVDTLSDFASFALDFPLTPASFNLVPWDDRFTSNTWIRKRSVGQTRHWKYLANCKQIELVAFDFEDGTPASEIHQKASEYQHVILASKNHLVFKDDGTGTRERFHLFIRLSEPVTDVGFYKYICKTMSRSLDFNPDVAAMEMSRYFFRHREVLYLQEGKCLGVEDMQNKRKSESYFNALRTELRQRAFLPTGNASEKFTHTRYYRLFDELQDGVGRYHKRCQIVGAMKNCGMDVGEAIEVFEAMDGFGGKFTEDTIRKLF